MFASYFRLVRPKQWLKNIFVLLPLLFTDKKITLSLLVDSFIIFVAFCLVSSSIYIINDIIDKDEDAKHPRKKYRAIASGKIKTRQATWFGVFLFCCSMLLATHIGLDVTFITISYFMIMLAYSFFIKRIFLCDIFCIAMGFILRVYAGAQAIGVIVSPWLLLNTFFLSLFLGFSKRRGELIHLADSAVMHRHVLKAYSQSILDHMLITSSCLTLVCYALYTIENYPIVVGKSYINMFYTVPLATYGIFRYIFIVFNQKNDEDIAETILTDRPLLVVSALWLLLIVLIRNSR